MQPITVVVGPLADANTTIVADAQSVNAATDLILVSSPVVLDATRQLQIASDADETAITFTIFGTTFSGQTTSEVVTGPNATTANTVLDFSSVTRIATSGATAGNVTVGTSNVAHTRWVRFDDWAPSYISVQCVADGVVDYTMQYTLDDPNSATNPIAPVDVTWATSDDTDVVNANASATSNFIFAPVYARVQLNSGNGSVRTTFLQSFGGV